MKKHPGVLKKGIQTLSILRHKGQFCKRIGNKGKQEKKEESHRHHNRDDIRKDIPVLPSVLKDDQGSKKAEEPGPEEKRTAITGIKSRDSVGDGKTAAGVRGNILELEIAGEQSIKE